MSEVNDGRFKGRMDRFNGVTVESRKEPRTDQELRGAIENSLLHWMGAEIQAVWFKVHIKDSHWIPILAKNSFEFHHAKPDYVSMVRWLPKNESSLVPLYAHTNVGVGGFVVNDQDEILVVQEHAYPFPNWKLPGGYVESGEELHEAASREVKEETGIDTEFVSMLTFRHLHNANFDCSDLYFVVLLRPLSSEIKICEREIEKAEWMKLDTYINHEHVHKLSKHFATCYLEAKESGREIRCVNFDVKFNQKLRRQSVYSIASTERAKISNDSSASTSDVSK